MSDFLHMPRRSIELPLGCKDLMDLDVIRNWKPASRLDMPWRQTMDELAFIEGQVAQLLQPAGESKLVGVSRFQDRGHVMIISDPDLSASVITVSWHNAPEQQAIREVFEEAEIPTFSGPVRRWKTKDALKYALPVGASEGARLISSLFRNGLGLGDRAKISVFYHEGKRA